MEKFLGSKADMEKMPFSYGRSPKSVLTPEEEREIVFGAKNRDPEAIGGLVHQYGHGIYRHIYYMVGNHSDAEDLAGQTLMKAVEAIERFEQRPGISIKSWFMRIAHNVGASHLRSKKEKNHVVIYDKTVDPRTSDFEKDVDNAIDVQNSARDAIQAVAMLPFEQAVTIRMRFLEEASYKDVASELGKSVAAVRVIQHRALKKLARKLANVNPYAEGAA